MKPAAKLVLQLLLHLAGWLVIAILGVAWLLAAILSPIFYVLSLGNDD